MTPRASAVRVRVALKHGALRNEVDNMADASGHIDTVKPYVLAARASWLDVGVVLAVHIDNVNDVASTYMLKPLPLCGAYPIAGTVL